MTTLTWLLGPYTEEFVAANGNNDQMYNLWKFQKTCAKSAKSRKLLAQTRSANDKGNKFKSEQSLEL